MQPIPRRGFYHNWISYAGTAIAILAFITFLFLLVFNALGDGLRAPYAGLVIFIVVPIILLYGLLLIPVGMFFEWRRWKRHQPPTIGAFPILDPNDPRHQRAILLVATVTLALVFFSVYGSYRAYIGTESVGFCGLLCHRPMQPEYVTHQSSPHARVACVECHIGPGAEYFFRSKLEGVTRVYKVATNSYPRPIPPPLAELRPSRAICEQCHWAEKPYRAMESSRVHFLPDKANTRFEIGLLVKVGGSPWNPQARGIHWHIAPNVRIEYLATDSLRQNIPWVRFVDVRTGQAVVYTAEGASGKAVDQTQVRAMECMDCHDRPTHIFRSPSDLLNRALAAGSIDPALPDIKATGVTLLAAKYDTEGAAIQQIAAGITSYYRDHYPDLLQTKKREISRAVAALQNMYRSNFFPYMKVRWDTYPDNIGHLNSPGCFRCHDGLHKSADGQTIGKDCTLCHTILRQGTAGKMAFAPQPEGLAFEHPAGIGDLWKTANCSDCHTGAQP